MDRWNPPVLTGGPSQANFCLALSALYRHMGDLPHVASLAVGKQILSDYVSYTPVVVSEAPPAIRTEARTYLTAVAGYLSQLAKADLSLGRLPTGALAPLATAPAKAAATAVLGYSSTQCHYTIGGN